MPIRGPRVPSIRMHPSAYGRLAGSSPANDDLPGTGSSPANDDLPGPGSRISPRMAASSVKPRPRHSSGTPASAAEEAVGAPSSEARIDSATSQNADSP